MTKKQKMMLPTYEEFMSVEYEDLHYDQYRKIIGEFMVYVGSNIGWTPSKEAVYWYEIKLEGKTIRESREFAASNYGEEKCWRSLRKTIEKMLNN